MKKEIDMVVITNRYMIMKLITSITWCILLFFSCSGKMPSSKQSDDSLSVVIPDMEQSHGNKAHLYLKGGGKYDFGTIDKDKEDIIPIDIEVGNTGNASLVIHKADVSCGCVSVDYPKEPILPGKTAKLNIKVNAKDQKGYFNKTIFLNSNASNDIELIRIIGQIK